MFPGIKFKTVKKSCNPLIDFGKMEWQLVISKLRLEYSELQWGNGWFLPVQKLGQVAYAHTRNGLVFQLVLTLQASVSYQSCACSTVG